MADGLVIRVDGSVATGTGHVLRGLALAQAWRETGGAAQLALADATQALLRRIESEGFEALRVAEPPGSPRDAECTAGLARERGATRVVLDGYHFGYDYQRALVDRGVALLVVDDHGRLRRYAAGWILDANLCPERSLYASRPPDSHLLLGPRFALLRREFARFRGHVREPRAGGLRILVTLGGADADDVTSQVVAALEPARLPELEAIVLVGGSNPHRARIEAAARASGGRVRVLHDVADVASRMAWADLAVVAGGTTCGEALFMGLPCVVLVLAGNQLPVAEALEREGLAVRPRDTSPAALAASIGTLARNPEQRRSMSERGRALVDGRGAERVVAALRAGMLGLTRARDADCRLLFEWANDPGVREQSFDPRPIAWPEHDAWFRARLADPSCQILVGRDPAGLAVGQVRVEERDREAEIHVSVAPTARGLGYGAVLIQKAVEEVLRCDRVDAIHAHVKPGNVASLRAFERAGFDDLGKRMVKGATAIHLVFRRPGA